MSQKSLVFSGIFLSKNDEVVTIEDFKQHLPEGVYPLGGKQSVQRYKLEYENSCLKIDFAAGSALPLNPEVLNTDTLQAEPNTRQSNQVEPSETFALIDFEQSILWISNSRKRNMLIDFLRVKFPNEKIIAKDIYSEAAFIETIKRLDNIKISAVPDLFSQTNTLTKALADEVNQYEAVHATVHFEYQNRPIGENLLQKIQSLFRNKENFRGIVVSGRDQKNLGMLFNSHEFSRKIEFKADVDENEMFTPQDVFQKLITTVENEKNQ